MRDFKDLKIAVAGTGYVGLSIATLLAQHHEVCAIDVIPAKVDLINRRKSPIRDEYIEKYLAEKELKLTATLDPAQAYSGADFVVIAAPTNYDSRTQHFDTSAVEAVIQLVMRYNPNAVMVIKSTIPVGYTVSVREKFGSSNIIFSPEFLRESKALYDNLYPSRIIVGTDLNDPRLVEAAHTFAALLQEGAIKENIDTLFRMQRVVGHHAVQRQAVALDVTCGHDRLGGQRVAGAHRQVKAQRLALVDRAGAGKLGAQQRGDHRAGPHAMRDRAVEAGRVGVFRVDMGRVHIARDQREGDDVVLRQRAADAGACAQRQLVEGEVGDRFGGRDRVHGGLRASGRQVVGALAREAGISAPHGSRRRRRASGRSCRARPARPGRPGGWPASFPAWRAWIPRWPA